jgi:ATP-dependent Clp protease ATP-binding subunit ClpA
VFERFTGPARDVVSAAVREATQLDLHYLGTEHLLLGLLDQPANLACTVLHGVGLEREYVRSEVSRILGPGVGGLSEHDALALQALGIDLHTIRSTVEEAFGDGVLDQPASRRRLRRIPFTRRAKKVLELSLREARSLRHDRLGPEHILLGLIDEGAGVAAQIMATKAPLPTLRQQVLTQLDTAA